MKCAMCNNNIKDGLNICPICGSNQVINNNQQQVMNVMPQQYNSYQQPVMNTIPQQNIQYQQPISGVVSQYNKYPQPIYPNQMYYPNNIKRKSWMDIVSVVCGCIGIYYLFSLLVVIADDLQLFIFETFDTPDMVELLEEPLVATICMTWPLFLAPILGIIFGILGRSKNQNKLNIFGIISNVVCLCAGILATVYIYTFITG